MTQKSPSADHRTTLSGYIFATKACIDNRKNLLNSNTSSTCPHNMANFGSLAAEIDSVVWGTPANSNGFCVLASLLQRRRSPEANYRCAVYRYQKNIAVLKVTVLYTVCLLNTAVYRPAVLIFNKLSSLYNLFHFVHCVLRYAFLYDMRCPNPPRRLHKWGCACFIIIVIKFTS